MIRLMRETPKQIVIITGQHMVANPRVWKEANSLAENGYKVTVLTTFYDSKKKVLDKVLLHPSIQYKAAVNLIKHEGSFADIYFARIWRRIALIVKKTGKIDLPGLLIFRLAKQVKLAEAEQADLYIAHQEVGLLVGNELIKKGKKVAFDFEDWYSHDYLVPDRPVKLLKVLEKFALANGIYCSCPSQSMANALKKAYPSGKKIEVLYNGFSSRENVAQNITASQSPTMVWFSQTIGPGRGLENFLEAMHHVKTKVELLLIGNCLSYYKDELRKKFPFKLGHQLIFHPPVSHYELISKLSLNNIGLAIENRFPESRNQTITNKILQYLQAGIRVLATDTAGQKEVASFFPDVVVTLPIDLPELWAEQIEFLLHSNAVDRKQQLEQFDSIFSWERQEKKILSLVENSLKMEILKS